MFRLYIFTVVGFEKNVFSMRSASLYNLVAIFIPCIQETTCKLEGQQHNNNQQRDNSSSGVTGGGSCVATSAEQSRASLRTRATSGESGDTAETRTGEGGVTQEGTRHSETSMLL